MTLIAGIVLPNGILMVSDTRSIYTKNEKPKSDYVRKITFVAPNCILGTTGSDSTFYTARVLRDCLYESKNHLDTETQRKYIIDLFEHVNSIHATNHVNNHPVGSILIADYNTNQNSYTLFSLRRFIDSSESIERNDIRAIELVGASEHIRQRTKAYIQSVLDNLTDEELNYNRIDEYIAKQCRKIFQEESKLFDGINDKLYCVYLTTIKDNLPASAVYLIDSDDAIHMLNHQEHDEEIILPIKN
ncbi:hypothetical protein PDN54_27190 [Bacillus cereus group sp. Bc252]|uniref:hypothetical protein n=1 Tax=Bacillus cereus group sp. Bc252 TaxID=3018104 RepID=UPI0022E632D0|nr:hypothetical protein [Bacillus cereus group sp. Bc252]MDA2163858.1 hypothetical protein [Bacillus cereus group sp. Bc252]